MRQSCPVRRVPLTCAGTGLVFVAPRSRIHPSARASVDGATQRLAFLQGRGSRAGGRRAPGRVDDGNPPAPGRASCPRGWGRGAHRQRSPARRDGAGADRRHRTAPSTMRARTGPASRTARCTPGRGAPRGWTGPTSSGGRDDPPPATPGTGRLRTCGTGSPRRNFPIRQNYRTLSSPIGYHNHGPGSRVRPARIAGAETLTIPRYLG